MRIGRRVEPNDRAGQNPAGGWNPRLSIPRLEFAGNAGSLRFAALGTLGVIAALATAHEPALPLEEAATNPGVVFSANFGSPELPQGWTFDRPEIWSVQDGRLRAKLPDQKQEKSLAYFGNENWKDYQVDLDVYGVRGVDKGIAVRSQGEDAVGIDLRGPGYDDVVMFRGYSQLGKAPALNPNGKWHHVRVLVRGGRYQVYVNRQLAIDYIDEDDQRPSGRLALAAYTGGAGACEVLFDNVVVRALN